MTGASEELKALCGDDLPCLVDGALGGIEDAQAFLDDREAFEEIEKETQDFVQKPDGYGEEEEKCDSGFLFFGCK